MIEKLLTGDCLSETIIGPKGDTYHRVVNVDILFGEDDYNTEKVVHINEKIIHTEDKKIKTPNRLRGLGGILITFDSEAGYTWNRRLLFHKGQVYTTDTLGESYE